MPKSTRKILPTVLTVAVVIILALLPHIIESNYIIYAVVLAMLFAMLTGSFDLFVGYTGPLSFCHGAFYGLGAYTSAILVMRVGLSFWLAMPITAVIVMIFAVIVGTPALKVRGHYFAVTTFFFGYFMYLVFLNTRSLTGGPMGITNIPPPNSVFGIEFTSMTASYYLIFTIGLIVIGGLHLLVKSGVGRILISIRENEDLSQAIGINTAFYKVLAFSISAGIAGMTGSLFAHFFRNLHPSTFAWMTSEMVVIMALVGGTGTLVGPIIGAGLVTFILEWMRSAPELRFIVWSGMLIVILLVEPKGLMGIWSRVTGGR